MAKEEALLDWRHRMEQTAERRHREVVLIAIVAGIISSVVSSVLAWLLTS